jgi:hypothetical protein
MWPGVIYNSQVTNKKQGGLPVRAPFTPRRIPIGCPGVIYNFQPAEIHKITTTNR